MIGDVALLAATALISKAVDQIDNREEEAEGAGQLWLRSQNDKVISAGSYSSTGIRLRWLST